MAEPVEGTHRMDTFEKLDWTKFASALRTMATKKLDESSNLALRCNAAGAAQERMIGELLRCIAVAIDDAQSDTRLARASRSQ